MKNMIRFLFVAAPSLVIAGNITFGVPEFSISSCPDNSISWTLSPNNNSLSLLFSQLSLTANANGTNGVQRFKCQIKIPFQSLAESSVVADHRGFHAIPNDANLQKITSYELSSGASFKSKDTVSSAFTENFYHSHQIKVPCPSPKFLTVIAEAVLSDSSTSDDATYELNSIDLSEAIDPPASLTSCRSFAPGIGYGVAIMSLFLQLFVELAK